MKPRTDSVAWTALSGLFLLLGLGLVAGSVQLALALDLRPGYEGDLHSQLTADYSADPTDIPLRAPLSPALLDDSSLYDSFSDDPPESRRTPLPVVLPTPVTTDTPVPTPTATFTPPPTPTSTPRPTDTPLPTPTSTPTPRPTRPPVTPASTAVASPTFTPLPGDTPVAPPPDTPVPPTEPPPTEVPTEVPPTPTFPVSPLGPP